MPLHLLGKKSWNVYNHSNIEKVKSDEAAAAAHEEEKDRITQEQDALRRTAILRGEEPPSFAPLSPEADSSQRPPRREQHNDLTGGERKRLRRGRDEDETDYAIRLAKQNSEAGTRASLALTEQTAHPKGDAEREVEVTDHAGHIQLFAPPDEKQIRRNQKNEEAEKEKRKKERELEDQYTMRFSNAAGFNQNIAGRPWYASASTVGEKSNTTAGQASSGELEQDSKNVWGRPDPGRKDRDAKRVSTNDPFAFMKKAQGQLKQSERDKEQWRAEKEREMSRLESAQRYERELRRAERRERRVEKETRRDARGEHGHRSDRGDGRRETHHQSSRRESIGSLEGFSLDAPRSTVGDEDGRSGRDGQGRSSRERGDHGRHRHRHRSRSRNRSRSRDRKHEDTRNRHSRHTSARHRRSRSPRRP